VLIAAGPLTVPCLAWAQTRFHSVQCCRSSISTIHVRVTTTSISTTTRTNGVLATITTTTSTTSTIACAVYLLA